MKQILQNYKTGELKLEEVPVPFLKDGGVLVRNQSSLVSIGTEKAMTDLAQKSIIGKAKDRPDLVKQVIEKAKRDGIVNTFNTVRNKLDIVKPLGYSSSGIVDSVGVGVNEFLVNDRVACAGAGYASHAEFIFVPKNLCAKIPENVSFEDAACTTLGAVALQGVRVANVQLGEKVAVIGLGLVGQITVQLLRSAGCRVIGFDTDLARVEIALGLGMDVGINDLGVAEDAAFFMSGGYGMDAVIITASTPSSGPVELAGKISRDKGRVVVVGLVGMDVPRESFFKKELDLRLSKSYGPGRYDPIYEEKGVDYPFGYVRWTEKRNMESFLDLISQGKLSLRPLITHCFPIDEAETIYSLLNGKISVQDKGIKKYENRLEDGDSCKNKNLLGVLIRYKESLDVNVSKLMINKLTQGNNGLSSPNSGRINVGLIGTGNFVRSTLIPALKSIGSVKLKGLASATGMNAKVYAGKHEFEYCTTDYNDILNDETINAVIIATRHDLHSRLVVEALQANKSVLVEKPLALFEDEVKKIIDVWKNGGQKLLVGFNRRFSPFTIKVKEFFKNRIGPIVINYRINAGFVPKESWVHDPDEGGGRIIGEVCHFVDLLQFFVSDEPVKIYAETMSDNVTFTNDNINIHIKFKDGSIGTITYIACGDKSFAKERIEVFGDGKVAVIDDFKSGVLVKNGKSTKIKGSHDKGHETELELFFESIKNDSELPIPFKESVLTTLMTFRIIDSLKSGQPVFIEECVI